MGIAFSMIEKLQDLGLFGAGRVSVLDIGSSNLYSASAEGIQRFLATHGVASTPELTQFANRLADGSAYDAVHGGTNGAFVGELLEKACMKYAAIDIADGYRTTILDLNHANAPPDLLDACDLVLNFGTTEHLLNQYNAFKVMHDSTKVGGFIVNSLPCVGYSNHGYFTYTPRCFFDLAGYNEYEVSASGSRVPPATMTCTRRFATIKATSPVSPVRLPTARQQTPAAKSAHFRFRTSALSSYIEKSKRNLSWALSKKARPSEMFRSQSHRRMSRAKIAHTDDMRPK